MASAFTSSLQTLMWPAAAAQPRGVRNELFLQIKILATLTNADMIIVKTAVLSYRF